MFSRARALRHALHVEPVPVGDELPVHDRQPVADVRPGVLARDRVHGVRAQRVLDRRARGAVAQRLVDPRRVEREALADAAVVDGDAGVLADEVLLAVGESTLRWIVSSTRLPGTRGLAVARGGERVAQVLRDVLQRPDVEVRRGVLDGALEVGGDVDAHAARLLAAALPARRPKTTHSSRRVAHHAVAPVGAAGDLAAGVEALERRLGVGVDHEAAVLVVEDGVGEDPLGERVDARARGSGAACTAARPRRRPRRSASCRGRRPGGRRASRRRGPPRPRRRSPARRRRAGRASR